MKSLIERVFNWLDGAFKDNTKSNIEILPIKDPNDLFLTESSTPWKTGEMYEACPHCYTPLSRKEWFVHICNTCGSEFCILQTKRPRWREIWDGEKWIYQIKYNDTSVLIEKEKIKFVNGAPAFKNPKEDRPKH